MLDVLDELGIANHELATFVEHTLLLLPGWAGLFRRMEGAPGPTGRSIITLIDFLARMWLDVLAYRDLGKQLGHHGPLRELRSFLQKQPLLTPILPHGEHDTAWPLFQVAQLAGISATSLQSFDPATLVQALLMLINQLTEHTRLRIWHNAYERHYRDEVLSGPRRQPLAPHDAAAATVPGHGLHGRPRGVATSAHRGNLAADRDLWRGRLFLVGDCISGHRRPLDFSAVSGGAAASAPHHRAARRARAAPTRPQATLAAALGATGWPLYAGFALAFVVLLITVVLGAVDLDSDAGTCVCAATDGTYSKARSAAPAARRQDQPNAPARGRRRCDSNQAPTTR